MPSKKENSPGGRLQWAWWRAGQWILMGRHRHVLRMGGQGWATRAAGSGDSTDEHEGWRTQRGPGVRWGDEAWVGNGSI